MRRALVAVAALVAASAVAGPAWAAKPPAPPAPTNPSTLEGTGIPTHLILDQTGTGSGKTRPFTPTGGAAASQSGPGVTKMARVRVEWSCAPGGKASPVMRDKSHTLSGILTNGFDGPIPVTDPPARVFWKVRGSCSWHVRVLDL